MFITYVYMSLYTCLRTIILMCDMLITQKYLDNRFIPLAGLSRLLFDQLGIISAMERVLIIFRYKIIFRLFFVCFSTICSAYMYIYIYIYINLHKRNVHLFSSRTLRRFSFTHLRHRWTMKSVRARMEARSGMYP